MQNATFSQAATDAHYTLAHASDVAERIASMLDTAGQPIDADDILQQVNGLGALIRVAMRSLS